MLAIDQKGDEQAERTLRDIAAVADVPFILIDPRAQDTDRWQPISGEVGDVVARVVEPIKATEEYYSDMLRLYLGVIARVLEHAGCWPPSLPFLVDCCQLRRFRRIRELCADNEELLRRVAEADDWVRSRLQAPRPPIPRWLRHLRRTRPRRGDHYSTVDGQPRRTHVLRARLPHGEAERIGEGERHACEIAVHRASTLEQLIPASASKANNASAPEEALSEPEALRLFGDRMEDLR